MQNILLIEDQLDFQLTVRALLGRRYHLILASTASEAVRAIAAQSIDLVLLDVSLPDADGFQLFTRLKAIPELKSVPFVFLTGKSEVNDRVAAFSLGADDYIVKPFEPLEFRARIESKLAARESRQNEEERVCRGRLELDRSRFRATVQDGSGHAKDLNLTPHEFRLLLHFITHEGQVLSRDQLMTVLWGGDVHVLERTIDRHVSSLRKKLDPGFEKLEAVHGVGYRFSALSNAKIAA